MAKNPHEKTVRADDKAVLCFELEYKSSKLHDKVDWESGQSTLADILVRFSDSMSQSDYPEEKKNRKGRQVSLGTQSMVDPRTPSIIVQHCFLLILV